MQKKVNLRDFFDKYYEDGEDEFSYLETDGGLDLDDLAKSEIDISNNPFFDKKEDAVRKFCRVIRDPDYLPFTCEHVFNIELLPTYHVTMKHLYNHSFPMLIGSRGFGKSFTLALYILWRLLINQGIKVVVVGAAFRQSKLIFNYCLSILERAPVYQSMCGNGSKIKILKGNDKCTIQVGESFATFLPLGDGETIRGERANIIIADEFSMIPVDVYETVVKGFTAVSQNPIKNVKQIAKMMRKKKKGLWSKEQEILFQEMMKSNQSIVSGTAYYSFNSFCDYWKKYKKIIQNKNIKEAVKEEDAYAHCNRKDFCVLRIPFDLIPTGFLDMKSLNQTKEMIADSTFQMEYGACLTPDTEVITLDGIKKIINVKVGDYVLTHLGRWRKVIEVMKRKYLGNIYKIKAYGNNQNIGVTPNHPFYIDEDWENSANLKNKKLELARFNHLNNTTSIKISDYVDSICKTVVNDVEYVYPKPSQLKCFKDHHIKYKSCIPNEIKLDYNFGLIIGYYAAEGSVGANGRAVSFSLDGHVDISLLEYIKELKDALLSTFEMNSVEYPKEDNVVDVCMNSRLVSDLLKKICPSVSDTKHVNTDILYSNPEFMKGFITGYWHGAGCVHKDKSRNRYRIVAGCTNKSLLSQVRLCMSYFGIKSSLNNGKEKHKSYFRGRVCNCKPSYIVQISESYLDEFIKFISDKEYFPPNQNKKTHKFIKRVYKEEHYSGFVYNLEVEEDHSYSLINATVHNCFPEDSNGFFTRKLIESCVVKSERQIGHEIIYPFTASIIGIDHPLFYAMGVDPASAEDNFSIVVISVYQTYRKIVYCWTIRKSILAEHIKEGRVDQQDYYGYCAKKIRNVMKSFSPCEIIALDAQGGGEAGVAEALADKDKYSEKDLPIFPVTEDHPFWDGKERHTDKMTGKHIIELVQFARADYISEANHGLKKDMIDKVLLFPIFDAISLSTAQYHDDEEGLEYDNLELCMLEIEELKDELATIQHGQHPKTNRDYWDTPEKKLAENKKGRLRKDRYSALLIANMAARRLQRMPEIYNRMVVGGFAQKSSIKKQINSGDKNLFVGPQKYVKSLNICAAVRRQ